MNIEGRWWLLVDDAPAERAIVVDLKGGVATIAGRTEGRYLVDVVNDVIVITATTRFSGGPIPDDALPRDTHEIFVIRPDRVEGTTYSVNMPVGSRAPSLAQIDAQIATGEFNEDFDVICDALWASREDPRELVDEASPAAAA